MDIFIMDWKLIIISFLDTRLMYIELSDRQHPRDLWKIHTHKHIGLILVWEVYIEWSDRRRPRDLLAAVSEDQPAVLMSG